MRWAETRWLHIDLLRETHTVGRGHAQHANTAARPSSVYPRRLLIVTYIDIAARTSSHKRGATNCKQLDLRRRRRDIAARAPMRAKPGARLRHTSHRLARQVRSQRAPRTAASRLEPLPPRRFAAVAAAAPFFRLPYLLRGSTVTRQARDVSRHAWRRTMHVS